MNRKVVAQLLPVAVLVVGLALTFVSRRERWDSFTAYLVPPKGIHRFTFGYGLSFADMLWLRAVQLFDVCDEFNKQTLVKSEDGKGAELTPVTCRKGVVFRFLDAATDADPRFQMLYRAGGPVLSVLISDTEGASILLEKGLSQFPKDHGLLRVAAYHSLYEVKDSAKAAEYLRRWGDAGGPSWVYSLAIKLMSETGKVEAAEALARSLLESERLQGDDRVVQRLEQRLQEIRQAAERQKPAGHEQK